MLEPFSALSPPQPHLIREIRLPFDFFPAAGLNSLSHTHTHTYTLLLAGSFSCFPFPPSSWVLSPSQVPSTPAPAASQQQWDREGSQQGNHTYLSSLLKPEKGGKPVKSS